MILGVALSCLIGFAAGYALGRFGRPLAALLFVLSVAPLALLVLLNYLGRVPNDTPHGVLVILILVLGVPGALAMFVASFFRD